MFRAGRLACGRRLVHHLVVVEDHAIIADNDQRLDNLTASLEALAPKLKEDTATLVRVQGGYLSKSTPQEFAKGAFDPALEMEGGKGPSGVWNCVLEAVQASGKKELSVVVLTNAADTGSPGKLKSAFGMEELVKKLREARADQKASFWVVGLDVTRDQERRSIANACAFTGGRALFLNCDGKDDDGTTLGSQEAKDFFKDFCAPEPKRYGKAKYAAQFGSPLASLA